MTGAKTTSLVPRLVLDGQRVETFSRDLLSEILLIIKIFFIENIPNFTEDLINEQYRFVNFIDVIYDNKLKLVATAATEINNITSSFVDLTSATAYRIRVTVEINGVITTCPFTAITTL